MYPRIIGALLLLFSSALQAAGEHFACQQPNAYEDYNVETLLSIAQSCQVIEVADLFFNRANHIRRVEKYIDFEQSLHNLRAGENIAYIDSYRIHIGLAEALFNKGLVPHARQTLSRLNRIYERSAEIAELRFRGYDLIADRLERRLRKNPRVQDG
ncbi:MAG: hypothetical protein B6D72_06700 [gamma proteobacterium symbiont of Ctena orbiculata]|uniref:Uncharacterized protein n=1 Tax=Candidatus Thiodiazotropha taylori TaxID=2792791 RepID=A0A944M7Y2_9GAMM|nr:hypothetical protein [Candidatus Thiodiazotropha taylori]PUB87612.1 MAG: hypothetical protein DBP00_08135 [gamma proteobacterium symbiont of Ctena orbiculata]MBT2989076.1 hypothetical protein [Candidatus Thiodiazotropha taylori]MBT2996278.1 hypothetical protein [Candidatus Thiodiazotropha taylori]MBT3000288.1 hypothetical protein [Candidatus Thiodiazotropha taylori]